MRRRIFLFILTAVFIFTQVSIVDAKGSRSRSFGGKSFSKSWGGSSKSSGGYSGSSKSSKGLFSKGSGSTSKSSGGYSGSSGSSSSRKAPGSYSSGGSTGGTTKSSSRKSAYMQDAYKKQTSKSNYGAYKQKLNTEQQKVYNDSMNRNFQSSRRMNFEDAMRTRTQRINYFNSRPIYVNVRPGLFGGPLTWGMGYVGMWDMWFLMHASHLFWYHHWHDIYPYRDHFDQAKFAEMEARVKKLEQENNNLRDPNYLDPDVDPDLQFSQEYQEKHLDNVYYTDKYAEPSTGAGTTIVVLLVIGVVLVVIISKAAKPRRRKTYNSRIY